MGEMQSVLLEHLSGSCWRLPNEASDHLISLLKATGMKIYSEDMKKSAEILLETCVYYSQSWRMGVLLHLIKLLSSCSF